MISRIGSCLDSTISYLPRPVATRRRRACCVLTGLRFISESNERGGAFSLCSPVERSLIVRTASFIGFSREAPFCRSKIEQSSRNFFNQCFPPLAIAYRQARKDPQLVLLIPRARGARSRSGRASLPLGH